MKISSIEPPYNRAEQSCSKGSAWAENLCQRVPFRRPCCATKYISQDLILFKLKGLLRTEM